jgi:hypothetical protein
MDLGGVSLDGLVSSDPEQKNKWYNGSGLLKQERSGTCTEDELRTFKLAKTDQQQRNSVSLLRSNATTMFSDGQHQQQMLSFSTPNPKTDSFLLDKTTHNATLSYAYHPLSGYNRNTGTSIPFFKVVFLFFIYKKIKLKGYFWIFFEYIWYPLWGAKN